MAPPIIDPKSVRAVEIIADIEIGIAVAVHIAKLPAQSPVILLPHSRGSTAAKPFAQLYRGQIPMAVIQQQGIRRSTLQEINEPAAFRTADAKHEFGFEIGIQRPSLTEQLHLLGNDLLESSWAHRFARKSLPVTSEIKIQIAISIHIRQRRRRGAALLFRFRARQSSLLRETPRTVIQKQPVAAIQGGRHQIQISIPIHIGKTDPYAFWEDRFWQSGLRFIDEFPPAQISEQPPPAVVIRETKIDQTVPIHIPGRRAAIHDRTDMAAARARRRHPCLARGKRHETANASRYRQWVYVNPGFSGSGIRRCTGTARPTT